VAESIGLETGERKTKNGDRRKENEEWRPENGDRRKETERTGDWKKEKGNRKKEFATQTMESVK
jgi:hypothetical protein